MFKRILRSAFIQNMLATLLAGYMALIKRTTRWTVIGAEHVQPIWDSREGVILTIWHGRFFMANSGWPRKAQKAHILISQSNDGDFVSTMARRLGLGVIRGSTRREGSEKDRGGAAALKDMVRTIRANKCMVITPDGPRGPRMQMGQGAVRLSKMTGAKIMPYALATRHRILFKSWDRFMFPLPFGRGTIVWGEPVTVERRADEASLEAARTTLQQRLIAANILADEHIGKEIVQPATEAKKARLS